MPAFKEVFSTTWKVLLALFLISLGLGLAFFIVQGARDSTENQRTTDEKKAEYSSHDTSNYRTKVPKFIWDKRLEWAIAHHCYFAGMSKAEIIQALGQPTGDGDYDDNGYGAGVISWSWKTDKCARFNGDQCAEFQKQSKIVFLQNGYASSETSTDYSCETLQSDSLSIPQFKTPAQEQAEAAARVAQKQKRDAANAALRARILPHVHQCKAGSSTWGWSDPSDKYGFDNCIFSTQEGALQNALEEARLGMAFTKK
jgi:hypothetical protein